MISRFLKNSTEGVFQKTVREKDFYCPRIYFRFKFFPVKQIILLLLLSALQRV